MDRTLDEFFRLKLHVPFLSYAIKVCGQNENPSAKFAVAEDVALVLTTDRVDGNIITWLGMEVGGTSEDH
ncbi:uncharacterized protein PHALS_04833 [Plasmopara halstedii]|uniref:Uncharacterized protein n=1 Tax=Plasmopara halstedii TaxID=4781 RepID=A0A0P1B183_PLAHL|nr:uncharacterized protein PHALS_04833 [Plasmopara halstedii]CEG47686.1 hypothetical protein PHALS_04833 [Plasmopara halstedii]|eukprot:XP_024584055.1 hypothetical protein PHALS_04833 [Plasmopara halstedii]